MKGMKEVPAKVSLGERRADGVFVGRERELSDLLAGVDDALEGLGRLFLVAGERGIGKRRLTDELVRPAAGTTHPRAAPLPPHAEPLTGRYLEFAARENCGRWLRVPGAAPPSLNRSLADLKKEGDAPLRTTQGGVRLQ
jgi:hypothetical protein